MADEVILPQRRVNSWMPFLLGFPLAGLAWAVVLGTPLAETEIRRYFSHPVEAVEIVMFCIAIGGFCAKLMTLRVEKASMKAELIPLWNGTAVDVDQAPHLLDNLLSKTARQKQTWLGQRCAAALDYLVQRKSTDGYDDQLRSLADLDAFSSDGSYGLSRFITWAVPILGFLGTVLGITGAIAGVTPEKLENNLSSVTDGLALAFDTTALALGLTMVIMFISFLVEKAEFGHMESVDRFVEKNLAHRFIRESKGESKSVRSFDPEPIREAIQSAGMGLVQISQENLSEMRGQFDQMIMEIRSQSIQAMGQWMNSWHEQAVERLNGLEHAQAQRWQLAEEVALERSRTFASQMDQLSQGILQNIREIQSLGQTTQQQLQVEQAERWQMAEEVASDRVRSVADQIEHFSQGVLQQVREIQSMGQATQSLLQTQQILQQNLASLAGLGTFDQAMHSLIGAVHMLTARAGHVGADWHGAHDSGRGPSINRITGQQVA